MNVLLVAQSRVIIGEKEIYEGQGSVIKINFF